MSVSILIGDVRERLAELPADHFDCVVTSPPYWGLRDYGMGRWEGGDSSCDHRSPTMRVGRDEQRAASLAGTLAGSAATNSAQLLSPGRSPGRPRRTARSFSSLIVAPAGSAAP